MTLILLWLASPGRHRRRQVDLAMRRVTCLRIPMKSAMHSKAKSATYSDLKPATVPI